MYTITRPGWLFFVLFLQNLALFTVPAAFSFAADAPPRVERDRLVRVRLAPEERAFIFGEGFTPVEIEPVASGLVFVGAPGRYAILVFGPASQQQLFVEIVDTSVKPGPIVPPTPPTPPPGPPIPPPDPTPSVQNSYGVGLPAYQNALKLALADECRQLSVAFSEAANDLHTGRLPADTKAKLDAVIDSLSPRWRSEWLPPVAAAVSAANAKFGTGLVTRKSIYLEVSLALGKAAE